MQLTAWQAKYIAYALSLQHAGGGMDRLSQALFNASVDLNPHQIDAALFALQSPLSGGSLLADEVGLGKTIEAGIVLCQLWAERKRRLLVICPASLRQQWAQELEEKFHLPALVLDAKTWSRLRQQGRNPLNDSSVVILSYAYAMRMKDDLRPVTWDLVVMDEAHKLRNAYRESNKIGQALLWALEGRRKLLLTATPLQNSVMELYGLSTLIDQQMFGDTTSFRSLYAGKFKLFDGLFGASDEILGSIESGLDFERRILNIYQSCRTPAEIDTAFDALRRELDASIQARLSDIPTVCHIHWASMYLPKGNNCPPPSKPCVLTRAHWQSASVWLRHCAGSVVTCYYKNLA